MGHGCIMHEKKAGGYVNAQLGHFAGVRWTRLVTMVIVSDA